MDNFQVGSHYHFIEVNPYLVFDRRKAYGMRLNIPAGTATRFEVEFCIVFCFQIYHCLLKHISSCQPGESKSVVLVSIGGHKVIRGGNGIVDDPANVSNLSVAMEAVNRKKFGHMEEENARLIISD